jgi:sulfatase maturation enzyme AslB (radical SAM superfamily)
MKVFNIGKYKFCIAKNYKHIFNTSTGRFLVDSELTRSPFGPEILEIELTRNNCPHQCKFCYRMNNNSKPVINMTLEQFKKVIEKIPKTLCQVSLGVTTLTANPDLIPILQYLKTEKIPATITITGKELTDELLGDLVPLLNGISLSIYNVNQGIDILKRLLKTNIRQLTLHQIAAKETKYSIHELLNAITTNRLPINRIGLALLRPKPVNKATFTQLTWDEYSKILENALDNGFKVGFDQCSKPFLSNFYDKRVIDDMTDCECGNTLGFIDAECKFWHCGFSEIASIKNKGIDLLDNTIDFTRDVWEEPNYIKYLKTVNSNKYKGCVKCPLFNLNDGGNNEIKK